MRFFMITTVAASVAVAIAMPAMDNDTPRLCSSATASNPLCCATDVLGAADLDCASPSTLPNDIPDFNKICAATGLRARCCFLSLLGIGVLCSAPI